MARKFSKKQDKDNKKGGAKAGPTKAEIDAAVRIGRVKLKSRLGGVDSEGLNDKQKAALDKAKEGFTPPDVGPDVEPDFTDLFTGLVKKLDLTKSSQFVTYSIAALCWMKRAGKGQIRCEPLAGGCKVIYFLDTVTEPNHPFKLGKEANCTKIDPILKEIAARLKACTIFKDATPSLETLLDDLFKQLK